jgi:predicted nucleic acid-binding protein
MKTIFLDTAGWLALGNKSDKWHCRAVQIYQQVARERLPRLTTDAVIIEVCNALRKPPLRPLALVLADNIYKAERLGYLEIVHVNPDLFREELTLFRERKDKDWSPNRLHQLRHYKATGDHPGLPQTTTSNRRASSAGKGGEERGVSKYKHPS